MILNITQHLATPDQVAQGVVEPRSKEVVKDLLTFNSPPNAGELKERADKLAQIVIDHGCDKAMIGGAPYFMAPLERALIERGITPLYAFSVRESVDYTLPDGRVEKRSVFRFLGFVKAAQA